jgi:PBP1b-binding outer membrane lipoprotein LpoB
MSKTKAFLILLLVLSGCVSKEKAAEYNEASDREFFARCEAGDVTRLNKYDLQTCNTYLLGKLIKEVTREN